MPRDLGLSLCSLAEVWFVMGRPAAAREACDEAEPLLRSTGLGVDLARLLCLRSELDRAGGHTAAADAALGEASALAVGAAPTTELGRALARARVR